MFRADTVPRFLNRLMGLPLAMQEEVMQRFELAFSGLVERMAAEDGNQGPVKGEVCVDGGCGSPRRR